MSICGTQAEFARSGHPGLLERYVGVGLSRGDVAQPVQRRPDLCEARRNRNGAEANSVWSPVVTDDAVSDQGLADLPRVVVLQRDVRAAPCRIARRGDGEALRDKPLVGEL